MFFQLYLYFHAAGKDTTFWPRVFEALRKNPLDKGPKDRNWTSLTQAKDDQLRFAEVCCEVAQMDLSEFFEVWGMFEPMTDAGVGDYENFIVNLTKEEAEQTVSRLMSGVDDLTSKYKAALENGWNPNDHIVEMTAGMTTQERYDFLVNAISIVKNLNVNILGDASDIKGDVEAAIAEMKASNTEVTDATCAALQASLAELLESSPLMLTGEDKIKEMMDAARGQSTNVVDFASSEYDDYRYKNEMALAAWIEHKEGNITSLPEGILPESLGVSIAAGVEEAHVMEEVASGNKTIEWAVKCLKILGGIALVCFLGYIALMGLVLTSLAFFEAGMIVMGTSTVAMVFAGIFSLLVSWGISDSVIDYGTKVLEWCGEAYDWVVLKLKDSVYPKIKSATQKLVTWVRSLFQRGGAAQGATC
jgi:hypothetical protein